MATKKLIYFTAGKVPSGGEQAEIDAYKALTEAPLQVHVRQYVEGMDYGAGPEECDYVDGTIPGSGYYNTTPTVVTPTSIKDLTTLAATDTVVSNSDTVAVRNSAGADSHNGTAVVANHALTGINLAATVAMVDSGDAVTIGEDTYTFTVAAGVITNIVVS